MNHDPSFDDSPPSTLPWACDPGFGIVHSFGCHICSQYMRHIATAANDLSLQRAIQERDSQYTVRYLRGVDEGIRLSQEKIDGDTSHLLVQYRAERDEERERADRRSAELLAAQDELLHVKQQFSALRALFDDFVDRAAAENANLGGYAIALEETISGSSPLVQEDSSHSQESLKTPRRRTTHALPTPPPSPLLEPSLLPSPPPTPPPAGHITPRVSFYPGVMPTEGSQTQPPDDAAYVQSDENTREGSADGAFFVEDSVEEALELNRLTTIVELMNDARMGHEKAVLKIAELYAAACATPIRARTTAQQFIILEWKPRPRVTHPSVQSHSDSEEESETPEIFVDSSSWGIGFVLNGRWLAWKLRAGWKAEGRDNNWGEMVAVELGLRVAIAAGLRSQTIVIRSDNWGVVRALITGKSRHRRQPEIMRIIGELTRRHGIELIPVWVPSKENPADDPSRGEFPSKHLLFPTSISIPSHLSRFLLPSIPLSALSR